MGSCRACSSGGVGVGSRSWCRPCCFTTVHFTYDMSAARLLLTFVTIGIAGVGFGWLRWRYRSLAYGMVAHATFNTIVTVVTLVTLSQR